MNNGEFNFTNKYTLEKIIEDIRDNTFAHRALSDALATGLLFKKLAQDKID